MQIFETYRKRLKEYKQLPQSEQQVMVKKDLRGFLGMRENSESIDWGLVGRRSVAFILDILFFAFLLLVILIFTILFFEDQMPYPLIGIFILIPLHRIKDAIDGQSFGFRLAGIVIIDQKTQQPVRLRKSIFRYSNFGVGAILNPFVVLLTKGKKNLGDVTTQTYIIRKKDLH